MLRLMFLMFKFISIKVGPLTGEVLVNVLDHELVVGKIELEMVTPVIVNLDVQVDGHDLALGAVRADLGRDDKRGALLGDDLKLERDASDPIAREQVVGREDADGHYVDLVARPLLWLHAAADRTHHYVREVPELCKLLVRGAVAEVVQSWAADERRWSWCVGEVSFPRLK